MPPTDRRAQYTGPDRYFSDDRNFSTARDGDDDAYEDDGDDENWDIPPVHNRQGVTAPVGFYVGQLEKMTREKKTRFTDYLRIRFDFRILAVISARDRAKARECVGQVVSGWANLTMGPRSTMRKWAEALLARELEEDEQPGKADLLGCMVEISIIPHETEQGEQTTKIGTLTPYRRDQLDPDQQPERDDTPRTRPPEGARRASAPELSGKPAPRPVPDPAPVPAPAVEPVAQAADPDREPWEDEEDGPPGAVDPVLAARARGRR